MRRTGLLLSAAVLLTAGTLGVFLALGTAQTGAPFPLGTLVLGSALLAVMTVTTALVVRAHYRRRIADLGRRIAAVREAPSQQAREAVAAVERHDRDWGPLVTELGALVASYGHALDTLIKSQEVLVRLRGFGGRDDVERGHSHSFVHPSGFLRSGRLIARLTPTLQWLAATPALQRYLGRSHADLAGRPFVESVAAEDVPALITALQDALREGEAHNHVFRVGLPGGEERFLQMDALARYTEDGRPLHVRCHFTDVTDRVRAERELRLQTAKLARANALLVQSNAGLQRLKESYRDLYHQAPVLYFSVDPRGHICACNDTLLQALGYDRADLLNQPYARLLTAEALARSPGPEVFQRSGEVETQWARKDGSAIDVWIRTSPILDERGQFVRSRSAAQDVTERNRLSDALRRQARELQRTNDELRRINQELEEFTYVVSHDLKEPLRTLEAFSTFLQQDYGDTLGDEGREQIAHLVAASRRLGRLIDDLLILGRAGKVLNTPRAFDFQEAVDIAIADLSDLIQRRSGQVRVEGPLPAVVGDRERLVQLVANLIANGLKYNRSDPPEVVIGCRAAEANGPAGAGLATLFVRDNGIGIAPQYHEQIFRLFRRLHRREEYEGTGAGLAICKKIVEAHGGRIWVESDLGCGATFIFTLPRAGRRTSLVGAAANGAPKEAE